MHKNTSESYQEEMALAYALQPGTDIAALALEYRLVVARYQRREEYKEANEKEKAKGLGLLP